MQGQGGKAAVSQACSKVLRALYSVTGSQEFQDAAWLSERQHRAHYKFFEDYSAAEAADKWAKDKQNPDVAKKRRRDGALVVAVQLPERVRKFHMLAHQRTLQEEEEAASEDGADPDVPDALARLRCHKDEDLGDFALTAIGEKTQKLRGTDTHKEKRGISVPDTKLGSLSQLSSPIHFSWVSHHP